ncbi:MAG: phosphopantetheine-binding protein [Thermodesulfobacteriota bacterium]
MKTKIVQTLNFLEVPSTDIGDQEQLVGGRLGIDSIDVLELVMMLEKDYGVKIEDKEVGAKVFANVRSLAEYVAANGGEAQH